MQRPASVTTFAVINIIFASLGVLGFIGFLISKFVVLPGAEANANPMLSAMEENAAFAVYSNIMPFLSLVISIVVLAAAIGMFKLRPWARLTTIAYGIYLCVIPLIGIVLSYALVWQPVLNDPTLEEAAKFGLKIGIVFALIFGLLSVIYGICMVVILNRPRVLKAFQNSEDAMEQPI